MKIRWKKHITMNEDSDDLLYRAIKSSRGKTAGGVWENAAYIRGWVNGFRAARRSEEKGKRKSPRKDAP